MKDEQTRLFFVVHSKTENEEIFETLEEADRYASKLVFPKIDVAIVKHAFKEDGKWNYEDQSDTFNFIRSLQ